MKSKFGSYLILSLIVTALFVLACKKDSPVAPLPDNPGALTWTVDTLAHPDNWQSFISDIWGSSARDVYAVGQANTTHGIMWHFNGSRWYDIEISITQGGPIEGAIDFDDVFGFGRSDIWAAGDKLVSNPSPPPGNLHKPVLIHYDGTTWREIPVPFTKDGGLTAIGGLAPDDFWIGGWNQNVYHFNGVSVVKDSLPKEAPPPSSGHVYVATSIVGTENTGIYLHAIYAARGESYLFELQSGKWVLLDDSFLPGTKKIWMSPSGTLYAAGEAVYQKQGETWNKILDGYKEDFFARSIYGVADDNFFVVGKGGPGINSVAYHYNGKSWHRFSNIFFPNTTFTDVWTDGREVFILGDVSLSRGDMPIVLHGK